MNQAVKHYWISKQLFTLDDSKVLWNMKEGQDGTPVKLLVVPNNLRTEVLRICHDVTAAGHQGVDRTKAQLRDRFFWYGMMKEAEQYVNCCGSCSRNKRSQRHARAGAPMERVHLYFLGPLPETSKGNVYVQVMVDQFTKWVECVPLPSQTAEVTVAAAVNEFFYLIWLPISGPEL